jgi:hypothetical protein
LLIDRKESNAPQLLFRFSGFYRLFHKGTIPRSDR